MKCRILGIVLFVSAFLAGSANAQITSYLPQVANGDFGSGSYRTTFVLFNNTSNAVTAVLDLTDDQGNPLYVNIAGYGTSNTFNFTLSAGSSKLLQTDGKGSVAAGAATVTSTAAIGVSAIFSIYDSAGNYLTETGVGSADPQPAFVLPVDTTGSFNTGLALYNPNDTQASITLTLRNTNGQTVGAPVPVQMAGGSHIARFIAGNGQLFPSIGAFQGTLLVQCSTPVAAMGLRQYQAHSTLSFTSLPVVPSSSTKTTLNVAQVAAGGGYLTSFLIFNISTVPANVTLELIKDDGSPFTINMPGWGNSNLFTIANLAPGGSVFMQTDGSAVSPAVGAAKITSDVPIGASGIFTVTNSGVFQTETGVGDSPLLTSFTLPADITGNFDTGVAFFNPGTIPATLSFRRIDENGVQVGSVEARDLPTQGHLAIFASQIFSASNFRGSVAVSSSTPVAAMTLRMNNPPLSFTTLPVVSGVSNGSTPPSGPALLSKTETSLEATTNVTLNETLPSGFKLTGIVSGPGTATTVWAKAGPDNVYCGLVDAQGKYVVVLPAGNYDLSVSFTPGGIPTGQRVSVVAAIPGSVQVTSDATRNITLPSVPVFNVSGTVNGIANLGTPGALSIQFTSADAGAGGLFPVMDGSYSGMLPAGNYTVGISADMNSPQPMGPTQSLGIYNLGFATIGGNATLPPFTVPATASLSGTVRGVSLPAFGITVTATGPDGVISSSSGADMFTAQYQALLPNSTTYALRVSMMLTQGTDYLGSITFPISGSSLNLTGNTGNYDFNVPSLPGRVTISGRVVDRNGTPVKGAAVYAVSESITGTPDLRYMNVAETDASGNYSLTVLSGRNYTLTFLPPLLPQ